MEALWNKYQTRGVQVIVIDVLETKEKVDEYAKRSKYTFPMLLDSDGKTAISYVPKGAQPDLPRDQVVIASNLIIDQKGKIQFYSLLDTAAFDAKLLKLTARLDRMLKGK